eukprot:TRINITY_DN32312_c0_g1_i1.p1 TRINITY_DN32312_c0_g1~~TRINITY_DN32312_c0_g1_i1.p1  ORF type:complete len:427 (-),score=82.37 TRINITY_DN32312_c0_g1_i1:415-1695(-)
MSDATFDMELTAAAMRVAPGGGCPEPSSLMQRRGLDLKVIPAKEQQAMLMRRRSSDLSEAPSTRSTQSPGSPAPWTARTAREESVCSSFCSQEPSPCRWQWSCKAAEDGPSSTLSSPGVKSSGLRERRLLQRRGGSPRELTLDCALAERENASANPFTAGTLPELTDRFDVLEALGQGTTGVVYKAKRKSNDEVVALKVMRMRDEEMLGIAREEFDILRTVDHPNVIRAFDFFAYPKGAVLVLEYFAGDTLETAVSELPKKRFDEATARLLFKGLLEGVAHLHKLGIIHRDIKPSNTLVSSDRKQLRLVDFNTARKISEGALTMTGTPDFMPPEVLLGQSHTEACDVWSAGLCLTFMLAGRLLHERRCFSSHRAFGKALQSLSTEALEEKMGGVTGACLDTVLQCLKVRPSERPCAGDMLHNEWLH